MERLETLDAAEREAIVRGGPGFGARGRNPHGFCGSRGGSRAPVPVPASAAGQPDSGGFTTVAELICGIEIRAGSHCFVWNLDSYLEGLEARLFETLDASAQEHATPR